jgi:opacity protein-like surface antigen
MSFVTQWAALSAVVAVISFVPAVASAQDERLRVSFTPAVAAVGGEAELSLAGSFGYRFSRHFWFEGEFTWIDGAAGGLPNVVFEADGWQSSETAVRSLLSGRGVRFGSRSLAPGFVSLVDSAAWPGLGQWRVVLDGRTMIGTLGLRYELPVQTERFRPYLAGGLGINDSEQNIDIERLVSIDPDLDDTISHTGYAFSAGAGASIRLAGTLWADADAKYFRLSRDRNVMRLGGGVTYRF